MHQLKVFRCGKCQAPFLFESSLVDHERVDHAPAEAQDEAVAKLEHSGEGGQKRQARKKKPSKKGRKRKA